MKYVRLVLSNTLQKERLEGLSIDCEKNKPDNFPQLVNNLTNTNGPWFPIIISDKCDGCAKTGKPRCVEFCPNDVFAFENGKAVVVNPANCGKDCSIPNCSACAPLCHNRAISFPSKNAMYSQVARDDQGLIRKTTCKVCGKQYLTNMETDVCFDCDK